MPHPATETSPAAVLPALHAQLLERGWLSANSIVFLHGGRGQVVDTGYVAHAGQTIALLEAALGGAPLAEVVNTHLHSDHCGGNAALARRWPQLQIRVPAASRSKLTPWDEAQLSYQETGQRCEPFTPQAYMAAGDEVQLGGRPWQVHAAPGHDPDAVLLFEPQTATLISGDALWERRLAIIFPELAGDPGFDAAAQLLDHIERLGPRLVLPGHGAAFTDVAGALAASRQRLAAFQAAPQRHSAAAARALVVYHMLEHRRRPLQALADWVTRTPIFMQALRCAAGTPAAQAAAQDTIDRLLADGVLQAFTQDGQAWVGLAE